MRLLPVGVVCLICYSVLLMQFYSASKKGYNSTADAVAADGNLAVLNQRHVVSLIAMAIAVLYSSLVNSDWLWLHTKPGAKAFGWTVAAGIAAVAVSVMAARQALRKHTRIHAAGSAEWYLLFRALFIVVYEIFFRAMLLQFCLHLVPAPVAVAINVVLYAGAHAFSTRQELIGTVPFGILLCCITLFAQSIWPAVFIHLLLALPYDMIILSAPKRMIKTFVS